MNVKKTYAYLKEIGAYHDDCPKCGRSKNKKSELCRKCYDHARRPRTTDIRYTECPSCGDKMKEGREKCTKCVDNERAGVRRTSTAKRIHQYIASSDQGRVNADTMLFCYYWRSRRMNILARSRREAVLHVRKFYGGDVSELVQSVCRLGEINLNLTGIDLLEYQRPFKDN